MKMSDYAGLPLEVRSPKPDIGGWLTYVCVTLTIFGPLGMLRAIHATSNIFLFAVYISLAIASLLAGITTWARLTSAFIWLRIYLGARLLYGFFQAYVFFRSGDIHQASPNEAIFAAVNIAMALILFIYFRVSSRVNVTFGRNI